MTSVAVIRTGLSNIDSVVRAVAEVGGTPYTADDPTSLGAPDRIVLPGVGAFAAASAILWDTGLADAIRALVREEEVPLLGICLGMQLLVDTGDEGGAARGLGLVPGTVRRFVPLSAGERVPHVGWNQVHATPGCPLFDGADPKADYYFVHSYHVVPSDPSHVLAHTPYCGGFASVVGADHVLGVQFHPEKSHRSGLALLRKFVET